MAVLATLVREQRAEAERSGVSLATRAWLAELQGLATPRRAGGAQHRLIYVVELDERARLRSRVYKVRLLKDGGYGKAEPYNGDGSSGAQFLQPADQRLLPLLPRRDGPVPAVSVPLVLRELAGLDRAHVGSLEGPLLREGPERAGRFHWVVRADGSHRLSCAVDGAPAAQALMSVPQRYLDTEQGLAGPLSTGVADELAAKLLGGPDVPAAELPEVASPLEALGVPAPRTPEQRDLEGISPVPQLHPRHAQALAGGDALRPLRAHGGGGGTRRHGLLRLPGRGGRGGPGWRRGAPLCRWRALPASSAVSPEEREAIAALGRIGLAPVELADDIVMTPDEDEDWIRIVTAEVPRLRANGWRVHIHKDFPYRIVEADDWYAELEAGEGNAWFDLELGVEVEGERHSLLPLLIQLIQRYPEAMSQSYLDEVDPEASLLLELGDGRLLPVPAARLVPLLRTLTELYDPQLRGDEEYLTLPAARAGALDALEEQTPLRWAGDQGVRELGRRIAALGRVSPADPPEGLDGRLRDYQRDGLGWLQALGGQQLGGILADDMGLGKTIQVLAHLLLEKEAGRAEHAEPGCGAA
ncbi:MAG: DEAD/DEAH box helicase [Arhodomonas sp.]|nr:DEAD/DEAH box helicase [Arhodomonas sp.]